MPYILVTFSSRPPTDAFPARFRLNRPTAPRRPCCCFLISGSYGRQNYPEPARRLASGRAGTARALAGARAGAGLLHGVRCWDQEIV